MQDKRLLLFDIDGTLVNTAGAGIEALKIIMRGRWGSDSNLDGIEIAGKTDVNIVTDILNKYGLDPTKERIAGFLDEYAGHLARLLPQLQGRILPGITDLLSEMKPNPNRVLALLTGNIERGAKLKLQRYGLWDYFEFGAFADDHHDRNELGVFAHRRAQEKHGHEFDAAKIDVIGDTAHDIQCGKAIGARTVAVATGTWSREQLAAHSPDFLFDDLGNVNEVMRTLGWS